MTDSSRRALRRALPVALAALALLATPALVLAGASGSLDSLAARFTATPPTAAARLGTEALAPPPNDNLANALIVTSGDYFDNQSINEATLETDEAICEGGDSSVWYSYTPTTSGSATVTVSGSNGRLGVYTGSTFPLTQVACQNLDNGGGGSETYTFNVTADTRYYIRSSAPAGTGNSMTTSVVGPAPTPRALLVDTNSDSDANATSLADCTDGTPDGDCSLREALTLLIPDARVTFNVTAANGAAADGSVVISPATFLDPIGTRNVTIDGTTQPGFSTTTYKPLIRIDGVATAGIPGLPGLLTRALTIQTSNTTVRGLMITRFASGIVAASLGGTAVVGCYIGTDGTVALANTTVGLDFLNTSNFTIGGTAPADRNVISGNGGNGILVGGSNGRIIGNAIGTTADGTAALPNAGSGISLTSQFARGNVIQQNSISGNGRLGIDLGNDGVTLNDVGDADTGQNGFQNFPVVTVAVPGSIAFTLNTKASQTYRVDFFASAAANPTGYGEGVRYLGFVDATTDAQGDASGTFTPTGLALGEIVTATATGAEGTSEFSLAVRVQVRAPLTPTTPLPAGGVFTNISSSTSYTVPSGGALTLQARGADGGNTSISIAGNIVANPGGAGATVQATFQVQANDVLTIVVGGKGLTMQTAGGGGGSAVILRRGADAPVLLLVAGAGGGGGRFNSGTGGTTADTPPGYGAGAGENVAGGGGGLNAEAPPGTTTGAPGRAGTLENGRGSGGFSRTAGSGGPGFGGGGASFFIPNGSGGGGQGAGGGGGGYGGGSGGVLSSGASGGVGGSSYVSFFNPFGGTAVTRTDGAAGGGTLRDGSVTLSGPATIPSPVVQGGLFNPTNAQGDGAGYRLLGAPVAGFTIRDLAALDLVQGVPAGQDAAAFPAQYPDAGHNLFPAYLSGQSPYPRPTGTDQVLQPGRGFFWYLYDRDITPNPAGAGGGTSVSRELTGFALSASGSAPTADVDVAFADNVGADTDNYHLLANPFGRPLTVGTGITTTGGALQGGVVQAFDTRSGSYVLRRGADRLAVWQGVSAELTPAAPGDAVTVTYRYAATDIGVSPTFYGKADAAPEVAFALAGTLASGVSVADSAAFVRLMPEALAGWDVFDASKLTPPTAEFALLAPVIDRDGARYRLALDSRSAGEPASVPLALATTGAGSFRLSWTATLPDGWTATLADTQTGQTLDLAVATELSFTASEAQDWAERFMLTVTPRGAVAAEMPAIALGLTAPAPNPATSHSALTLTLPTPERVRAIVVDALGREVGVLLDGEASGAVRLSVDTARLAPGVYTVRVAGASFALARRLTVVR